MTLQRFPLPDVMIALKNRSFMGRGQGWGKGSKTFSIFDFRFLMSDPPHPLPLPGDHFIFIVNITLGRGIRNLIFLRFLQILISYGEKRCIMKMNTL
jgi:hypothetical protein